MTENKGDLISREALKKAYFNAINETSIGEVSIIALIDNAPTVDCVPTEFHEKALDETVGELLACQANLRPQGEWIFNITHWSCSACNETVKTIGYCGTEDFMSANFKFCPNCGAEMKPKPNHLRDCENCVHHSDNGCEVWECEFKRRSS